MSEIPEIPEEGPPDASGDAVIDADHIFNDDLAPGVCGHR
jgi:hypothetical protein